MGLLEDICAGDFEDKDGDFPELRSYKINARLEKRLLLMPRGDGTCAQDHDEEEQNKILADPEYLPEGCVKRSVQGIGIPEKYLLLPTEAQAERVLQRLIRVREQLLHNKFRDLYYSCMGNAENPDHWMRMEDVPNYLGLARNRPLMCKGEFGALLDHLCVHTHYRERLELDRQKNQQLERHKALLKGLQGDNTTHPSAAYQHVLPKGQAYHNPPQVLSRDTSRRGQLGGRHNELETTSGEDVSESEWNSLHCTMSQSLAKICNTIENFRHGGYKLEDIEAAIGNHLKVTNFRIKKYASMIGDASFTLNEVASEIYTAALLGDFGDSPPSDDDNDDANEDSEEVILNAITLLRRGEYSLKEAKRAIRKTLKDLRYFLSHYISLIKDPTFDAESVASLIYQHALEENEGSEGSDEDEDSQNKSYAGRSDGLVAGTQNHVGTGGGAPTVNFSPSQLTAIYNDVLYEKLAFDKAPAAFRRALNKPGMPNAELATILDQIGIPSDMFFASEEIPDRPSGAWESTPGNNHVRFDEGRMSNKDTPPDSRKSSAWDNIAARPDPGYPDTPPLHPDDDMPPLERASILDRYINGNLTNSLLSSATQKLAEEPVVIGCLYDDTEEAELPGPFPYEDAFEHSGGDDGGVEEEQAPSGGEVAKDWVSEGSEEGEIKGISKHTAANTFVKAALASPILSVSQSINTSNEGINDLVEDEGLGGGLGSPVDATANGSLPPQPSATPATANTTATQLWRLSNTEVKSNGSSMGPPPLPVRRIPKPPKRTATEMDQLRGVTSKPTSCPDQRSDENRPQKSHVGYQNMKEIYMDLGDSSPDDGETDDLHGIIMPTKTAQLLASEKYKLSRDYVETYIRSDTADRAPRKKAKKASSVRSVPTLKLRSVISPSEGPASKSADFEDEIMPFAGEGDDHRSFMERRVKLRGPVPDRQRVPLSLSEQPEGYVKQVHTKINKFLRRAQRSKRRYLARELAKAAKVPKDPTVLNVPTAPKDPGVPTVPKKPADDLYERAWDEKVSIYVYLWQRRHNRQIANRPSSADRYFSGVSPSAGKSNTFTALNKLFDKYRGMCSPSPSANHMSQVERFYSHIPIVEDATDSPDTVGITGTMHYLTELGVALDEPAVVALLTELAAPTMGELSRDGFNKYWAALRCDTLQKQQTSVNLIRENLSKDIDFFRKVYKHTFRMYIPYPHLSLLTSVSPSHSALLTLPSPPHTVLIRQPGQKGVQLDSALDFWRLLFGPQGGFQWKDPHTDWLALYIEFLDTRWRKSINKDLWDQTLVFAQKTLEDGTLGWWSEDGAWPGVVDEFVASVRERRGDEERMVE